MNILKNIVGFLGKNIAIDLHIYIYISYDFEPFPIHIKSAQKSLINTQIKLTLPTIIKLLGTITHKILPL